VEGSTKLAESGNAAPFRRIPASEDSTQEMKRNSRDSARKRLRQGHNLDGFAKADGNGHDALQSAHIAPLVQS
jgi:hypothetical protein